MNMRESNHVAGHAAVLVHLSGWTLTVPIVCAEFSSNVLL